MADTEIRKLEQQLAALKARQNAIDKAWQKTGNRPLLQFFVDIIPSAVQADRCSIFIHDPVEESVWLECGTGLKERQITVPKASSMVGNVISTGEAQFRTEMNELVGAHATTDMQTGYVTYDALCVPIKGVTREEITGAIQVLNKKGAGGFIEEDKVVLERLALLLQSNIESLYLRQEMYKVSVKMGKKIFQLQKALNQA